MGDDPDVSGAFSAVDVNDFAFTSAPVQSDAPPTGTFSNPYNIYPVDVATTAPGEPFALAPLTGDALPFAPVAVEGLTPAPVQETYAFSAPGGGLTPAPVQGVISNAQLAAMVNDPRSSPQNQLLAQQELAARLGQMQADISPADVAAINAANADLTSAPSSGINPGAAAGGASGAASVVTKAVTAATTPPGQVTPQQFQALSTLVGAAAAIQNATPGARTLAQKQADAQVAAARAAAARTAGASAPLALPFGITPTQGLVGLFFIGGLAVVAARGGVS